MSNQKDPSNIRTGRKRLIDFTREERKEVIDSINEHGSRDRAMREFNTTLTVINLIYGARERV